jgi:hypothetical protein
MTQDKITYLQDMIDDFMSLASSECTIESEGYPHQPYISSLGVTTSDLIHFIDNINEHLGNSIELSQILLNKPSFKQCMYNLSHNILKPEVLLSLVKTSDVVDSLNNKLVYSIWKHDSGRLIQLLQQEFHSMNNGKDYMKTLSCNEVIQEFNKLTKETDYILKGTI